MKIENCKNIHESGTFNILSCGIIPLFEMVHDIGEKPLAPAKMRMQKKRAKDKKFRACRHSDDCFACPKRDCVADGKDVAYVNILPDEHELLLLGGR